MSQPRCDGAASADRRTQIEAVLVDYPNINAAALTQLTHWFHKEASALDVALVASNEMITQQYRSFRADHVDRFKTRDIVHGLAFTAVFGGFIFVSLIWPAL
ncbi:hypothetical protein KRR38_30980 [Novosphingobium sp. G106]|uniref:hypothetical protein n=1 Tax=Novosphingobium sp. G106 TaxID=2849500 RepID=UPI001C2DED68|nr:hypothetical protein [Novosphingobium sp. G106]MBV1691972.1 hypothetical protein [Novosphingobium sp. G106]